MENFDRLLDIIKKNEGGVLHRNKNEDDITTGYGIYRKIYPNDDIFIYIDEVAKELGITKKSNEWNDSEISKINDKIDDNKERELSKKFYQKYFNLDFTGLNEHFVISFCLTFLNSNKIANKSLQASINYLNNNIFNVNSKITIDGKVGSGTKNAFKELIKKINGNEDKIELLTSIFLNYCFYEYISIATDNGKEDKQLPYLKGWSNRLLNLMERKY